MEKGLKIYSKELALRILAALALGIFRSIFYIIFTPLTLHWSYFFFNIFVPESALVGTKLLTFTNSFDFVPACTAASAYMLLAFLVLLTKDIRPVERLKMFVYGSLAILAFNLVRIELLLFFFFKFNQAYPAVHLFFWKFMSTVFVVAVWLILAKIYKIKSIPIYSDLKYILRQIKR